MSAAQICDSCTVGGDYRNWASERVRSVFNFTQCVSFFLFLSHLVCMSFCSRAKPGLLVLLAHRPLLLTHCVWNCWIFLFRPRLGAEADLPVLTRPRCGGTQRMQRPSWIGIWEWISWKSVLHCEIWYIVETSAASKSEKALSCWVWIHCGAERSTEMPSFYFFITA